DAEPLETASVEVLEEAAPTHGLLLEERPMSGNQAVLLSPDGTCRLVKVAAGSGAELPGTGTASRPELRSGWAPCPKVQELARGMKPGSPAPPVPSASSSDTEGGGSAGKLSTGMKLLEEVERLRTTHVKYAHEAHAVLPVRVEQLWEEQVRQAEKLTVRPGMLPNVRLGMCGSAACASVCGSMRGSMCGSACASVCGSMCGSMCGSACGPMWVAQHVRYFSKRDCILAQFAA
ncbi:hypothetical protein CYMTET_35559, partial [Cymbomonas tetramitiformis]